MTWCQVTPWRNDSPVILPYGVVTPIILPYGVVTAGDYTLGLGLALVHSDLGGDYTLGQNDQGSFHPGVTHPSDNGI